MRYSDGKKAHLRAIDKQKFLIIISVYRRHKPLRSGLRAAQSIEIRLKMGIRGPESFSHAIRVPPIGVAHVRVKKLFT